MTLMRRSCSPRLATGSVSDLGWMYTLFFVLLGVFGRDLGRLARTRRSAQGGRRVRAVLVRRPPARRVGVYMHQLWLMWLGSGVIGGIGLGLGYISPVSTLIKWFPDRRGMATGMAIMGFGGGAMIGSPLANLLMNYFKTPTSVGVWQTFVAMAAIYFVFMLVGAFGYRLPPAGWRPEGWTPPRESQRDDHAQQRAPEGRAQDAAILADLGGALPQRVGGHRRHRHGLADAAGDLRAAR